LYDPILFFRLILSTFTPISTLFPYTTLFRSKCSQCGSIMSVNARSHNNYKTIHYSYVCNDCHSKGRPFMSVSESILENAFYDYMRDFPITDLNKEEGEEDERDNQIKNLLRRRKNIDRERDKIQRAWIKDMMSDEDL